jgi:hypothetical protein
MTYLNTVKEIGKSLSFKYSVIHSAHRRVGVALQWLPAGHTPGFPCTETARGSGDRSARHSLPPAGSSPTIT